MVKSSNFEDFKKFAEGIKRASDILRSKKPTYLFAPVVGAVPFVDLFYIADRHFELGNIEYPPNSSRFKDREEIMAKWYAHFLNSTYAGENINIVCVDEVISGSSAVKGYDEFARALNKFGKAQGENLTRKITYEILGIGESPRNKRRNHGFNRLVNAKKAHVVEVGKILTADDPVLNPVRLRISGKTSQGRHVYVPQIERFEITPEYLTLLQNFASYIGVDPSTVSVQNMGRIRESLENHLQ